LSLTPDSVEIESWEAVKLHIINFQTSKINASGPRGFYSSSLNSIVGYWLNLTDTPATASLNAMDVSLISVSGGQFRFTGDSTNRAGKLYVLTLT
jgi:hypothetical protein